MKVGKFRNILQWFPYLTQCIKRKAKSCGHATIINVNVSIMCHVTWALITTWQQCLWLFTSQLIVCCGMTSLSCWRVALKSLSYWNMKLQVPVQRLSWPHRFSMRTSSGESVGHSSHGILVFKQVFLKITALMTWSIVIPLFFIINPWLD